MLLADALSRCPARYSQEIKLDLHVDYIAFTSAWISHTNVNYAMRNSSTVLVKNDTWIGITSEKV